MKNNSVNNLKLGTFVASGLLFLIILLYMIGKNRNLFGATFVLRTRFDNTYGLMPGNNVRFSGIQVGTVKRVNIISDTLIEVEMIIDEKMLKYIHKNAVTEIGTDGLVGSKIVNISPSREPAPLVQENDILIRGKQVDTQEMLRTLSKTNSTIAFVADELKSTAIHINQSRALWRVLDDSILPDNLRRSASNIRLATAKAYDMVNDLDQIVSSVKKGKGSLGSLLVDSAFSMKLNEAVAKINNLGDSANELAAMLNITARDIKKEINSGKGTLNYLLKDSSSVMKLQSTLTNIEKGTEAFNQNMEALKHNFLFRGYFRKQEKKMVRDSARANLSRTP